MVYNTWNWQKCQLVDSGSQLLIYVCQAKCESDKQISALSETVSQLQQRLKCAECERATLQDQLTKSHDEISRLQRKLTAADAAQRQLNEVYTIIGVFSIYTTGDQSRGWSTDPGFEFPVEGSKSCACHRRREYMGVWYGRGASIPDPPQKMFFLNFIFGSRNAHFSAFSGPSECVLLPVIRPGPDLQYACPLWHSRLTVARSKVLESLQAAEDGTEHYLPWYSENVTDLIVANVKTLSHDDSSSHSFSSEGREFGGHGFLAPLGLPLDQRVSGFGDESPPVGSVWGTNDISQDCSSSKYSSIDGLDFWFHVTLSRWWPWGHFMQKSTATWWVHTKHLPGACAAAAASSWSVIHA